MRKTLLENLGLILLFGGAFTLIASALIGHINNAILSGALTTIITGIIAYILINKRINS